MLIGLDWGGGSNGMVRSGSVLDQSYGRIFLAIVSVAALRPSVKMLLWKDKKFFKNMFLIWVMANCLMERKRDDWRIFDFGTIFGDTVMVHRLEFWIRSGLS